MQREKVKNKRLKHVGNRMNNGITLIALVITIIVLLSLAGVSIATLTGDNGILTKATESKEQTEIGEEKEAIGIAYNGVKIDNEGKGVSATDLQTELRNNGYNASVTDNGDGTFTVTFESGREYTIDANGSISGPTVSNIVATMKIVGEKVETPPMPSSDFTHIEGTVDTGYVIQDSAGNEFVWVPVDKNQKIQINVTSQENIESLVLTDPYGDEIALPNISNLGTSYHNTEIEPTINGSYKLSVTTGSETKEIELNVNSLYAIRMWELDMLTEEIAIAMGYENLEQFTQNIYGMSEEETKNMISSIYKEGRSSDTENYTSQVNENGGFYIGRYEASYENGNVVSKVSTSTRTLSSTTLTNGMLWNYITQTEALLKANNIYTSTEFTSSLLTGAAWDRTLSWLEETGAVSIEGIIVNSTSWGNYSNDTFSNTTSLINTGSMSQTEKNHIYDLAGNLGEWTTEAFDTVNRMDRGGYYNNYGSGTPAAIRFSGYSPSYSDSDIGFRLALYL